MKAAIHCLVCVAVAALLCAAPARADVVSDDQAECFRKGASDFCTPSSGLLGWCGPEQVHRIHYGPKGPEGSRVERVLVCKSQPLALLVPSLLCLLVAGIGGMALYRRNRQSIAPRTNPKETA